jgi:hypothetical protein
MPFERKITGLIVLIKTDDNKVHNVHLSEDEKKSIYQFISKGKIVKIDEDDLSDIIKI